MLFQRDFITLNSHFALTLQQLLHVFGDIISAGERLMRLLTQLRQGFLRRQPRRGFDGQRLNLLFQLLSLLTHFHTAFAAFADTDTQAFLLRLEGHQHFIEPVRLNLLPDAFAEIIQRFLRIVLAVQTLFQFG